VKKSETDFLFEFAEKLQREETLVHLEHLERALAGMGCELEIGELEEFQSTTFSNAEVSDDLTAYVQVNHTLDQIAPETNWEQSAPSSKLYTFIPLYAVSKETGEKAIILLVHFSAKDLAYRDINLLWQFDFHQRIDALVSAWATPAHNAAKLLEIPAAQLRQAVKQALQENKKKRTKKELLLDITKSLLTEYYNALYTGIVFSPEGHAATYAFTEPKTLEGNLKDNHEFVPAFICYLLGDLTYAQLTNFNWQSLKVVLKKLGRAFNGAFATSATLLERDKILILADSDANAWSLGVEQNYLDSLNAESIKANTDNKPVANLIEHMKPFREHAFIVVDHIHLPTGLCPVLPNPNHSPLHLYDAFVNLTAAIVETTHAVLQER
jgi:hypothetical protein